MEPSFPSQSQIRMEGERRKTFRYLFSGKKMNVEKVKSRVSLLSSGFVYVGDKNIRAAPEEEIPEHVYFSWVCLVDV